MLALNILARPPNAHHASSSTSYIEWSSPLRWPYRQEHTQLPNHLELTPSRGPQRLSACRIQAILRDVFLLQHKQEDTCSGSGSAFEHLGKACLSYAAPLGIEKEMEEQLTVFWRRLWPERWHYRLEHWGWTLRCWLPEELKRYWSCECWPPTFANTVQNEHIFMATVMRLTSRQRRPMLSKVPQGLCHECCARGASRDLAPVPYPPLLASLSLCRRVSVPSLIDELLQFYLQMKVSPRDLKVKQYRTISSHTLSLKSIHGSMNKTDITCLRTIH